jgi:hypothetical protein
MQYIRWQLRIVLYVLKSLIIVVVFRWSALKAPCFIDALNDTAVALCGAILIWMSLI